VPGFEAAASDCLNRALAIARSLNHVVLSSDHLMIALTMDPNARRQLERVGDVMQLREAAMQWLGKMHSRYSTSESFPSQTSDLKDIRTAARQAAAARE
jgi:ATP-dependent Clp protease ATP-binding subunit ClpA